ncbi:MAG: hypothetical protein QOG50_2286, partial [Actinomycetota bacterium]|nr:hypothetical protein [Actinomycetota bacterium]
FWIDAPIQGLEPFLCAPGPMLRRQR